MNNTAPAARHYDPSSFVDAHRYAREIGAPTDMIQEVTFGDGRRIWQVIRLAEDRFTGEDRWHRVFSDGTISPL